MAMTQDIRHSRQWQAVRKAVIARDQVCTVCGTDENLSVDHIIPISKGGSELDPENLTTMCMTHNRQKSNNTAGQTHDYINPVWRKWESNKLGGTH